METYMFKTIYHVQSDTGGCWGCKTPVNVNRNGQFQGIVVVAFYANLTTPPGSY